MVCVFTLNTARAGDNLVLIIKSKGHEKVHFCGRSSQRPNLHAKR